MSFESQAIVFYFKNNNNSYFYLAKYLKKNLGINFNNFIAFKNQLKTNNIYDDTNVLYYKNTYLIDFKKIKYNEFFKIKLVLENILLKAEINIDRSFLNYNFIKIIFLNIHLLSENNIKFISNIIEKYQVYNNIIIFLSDNTYNSKYNKIMALSLKIRLNPIKEFKEFKKLTKNEILMFKLLEYDIIKFISLKKIIKRDKISFNKMTKYDILHFLSNNILLYKILNKFLLTNNILDYVYNLLSIYNNTNLIIKYTQNLIFFINNENIEHKLLFKNNSTKKILLISNINIKNTEPIITLKNYFLTIENIYKS